MQLVRLLRRPDEALGLLAMTGLVIMACNRGRARDRRRGLHPEFYNVRLS